ADGDVILGLAASGPHSNGYSLIRRVLEHNGATLDLPLADSTLGAALLRPTRIYVPAIRALQTRADIHAMAHITGGGLAEHLARVLSADVTAHIQRDSWTQPAIFDWLAQAGGIADTEMLRTFNCGVGFVVVVPPDQVEAACTCLRDAGEQVVEIGRIQARTDAAEAAVRIL